MRISGLSSVSLAVPIPFAIKAMPPDALKLHGVSYDPECSKMLRPVAQRFEESKSTEAVLIKRAQEWPASGVFSQRFEAPLGTSFTSVESAGATFSASGVQTVGKAVITEAGRSILLN